MEVLAVWFSMFPGDSKSSWPANLLTDGRVKHSWDQEKLVGRAYGEQVTPRQKGNIVWDAYFLYPSGARWEESAPQSFSWGRTIVGTRNQLKDAIERLIED